MHILLSLIRIIYIYRKIRIILHMVLIKSSNANSHIVLTIATYLQTMQTVPSMYAFPSTIMVGTSFQ